MQKIRKITTILTLAVAFCLLSVSLAEAITQFWAADNLQNKKWPAKIPVWKIIQNPQSGVPGKSIVWADHAPNPRFAIYDTMGNSNPADYATLRDDVVLDKETGLMWARDADMYGQMTWQNAINTCRSIEGLGWRQGWRLPTIEELGSFMDPTGTPPFPNGHPFINIRLPGEYWSSTSYESNSSDAWVLELWSSVGLPGWRAKTWERNCWPVRGGNGYATGGNEDVLNLLRDEVIPYLTPTPFGVPKTGQTTMYETGDDGDLEKGVPWPVPRFTDHGDGTVTDSLTGLMWTKNANIYGTRTWSQALSDCASCTEGGYSDWYLPNLRELQSLIHYGVWNPALPDTAGTGKWSEGDPFMDMEASYYWSSTTIAVSTSDAWTVHFFNGNVLNYDKAGDYYVWCVRGGQ